jgi:hypothetical protein
MSSDVGAQLPQVTSQSGEGEATGQNTATPCIISIRENGQLISKGCTTVRAAVKLFVSRVNGGLQILLKGPRPRTRHNQPAC